MNARSKLIMAGLAATLLMALAVSAASAARLSFSHGELVKLQFHQLRFVALGVTQTECDVTLEASFHTTTIAKIRETLIGYLTRGILGTCNTGAATILTETLPWHIQYDSFREALPRPRVLIRLILAAFQAREVFGGNCLARTSGTNPAHGITETTWERNGNGIVNSLQLDPTPTIPTTCAFSGRFSGTTTVVESGGAANVLLRLI